jgi:colanic acid biosynthesis glycosyl transferase WcaI
VPPRGAIRFVAACAGPGARLFATAAAALPRLAALDLPPPAKMAAFLAAADIHLMPEGATTPDPLIPAKLASLLASGRPVLAPPPAGPFALPLDATSGERIADAVIALAAAVDERRARGLAARRAAEDYFAKERVLRRLERRLATLARP